MSDGTMVLWAGMHPNEMRPREEFKPGCLVDCVDRPELHDGRLLEIDADNRLGMVEWGSGHWGWWFLKDLVVVEWPMMLKQERAYDHTPLQVQGSSREITTKEYLETPILELTTYPYVGLKIKVHGGGRVA